MQITSRSKAIAFFIVLGSLLVAVAIALNITWILHWRGAVQLMIGIVLFALIIAGLILNTIFLVREIRRNEQHDSFLNAVTHELRTPIASIRLYLETLQSREVGEEKRQDFYRIMHQDTDRLMSSVDLVLRAAETVQKRRKQHWTAVAMVALVEECVASARERHRLNPDALGCDNHGLLPREATVMGDADELRVAVTNLLDNAVKYSPEGVHIAVDIAGEGPTLLVTVSDQGIGIPPADLKRIFKRFYRAGWARTRIKGTGLGLFIVRSIVRKHRGNVVAASKGEGKGAIITLRLPRVATP
ncbi:MAG TPA: HAMP domain-containing sensor histidine kinase [Steroidobacteraceae bacterium]|jgi:signal transduction histidine kinase